MTIIKMHKIICVIAFLATFAGFVGEANAFGFPIPFKEYLASSMRSWTTSLIGKKKLTKNTNNLQLAEENAERGSGYEVAKMYKFLDDAHSRFGDDPSTYEATFKKMVNDEVNDMTNAAKNAVEDQLIAELEKQKAEEEARKKAEEDAKKAAEDEKQKNATGTESDKNAEGQDADNKDSAADEKTSKNKKLVNKAKSAVKENTYNWLKSNRSQGSVDGKIKLF